MKKKISNTDVIMDKKLTRIFFFNQFNMTDTELLVPVCVWSHPEFIGFFFLCILKKIAFPLIGMPGYFSWHIKQIFTWVIHLCLRVTPDKRFLLANNVFIPKPVFAFSTDFALNPELLCSTVLPSVCATKPSSTTKKLNDIKSLWCSQRKVPVSVPCKHFLYKKRYFENKS